MERKGPSRWMPRILASVHRRLALPMLSMALCSRSTGAARVVGTMEVVPRRAWARHIFTISSGSSLMAEKPPPPCTWISAKPGERYRPRQSTICSAGTVSSVTARILPFWVYTLVFLTPSSSTTLPLIYAVIISNILQRKNKQVIPEIHFPVVKTDDRSRASFLIGNAVQNIKFRRHIRLWRRGHLYFDRV